MCLAEVNVTEQVLQQISKFPEILGKLSMRKQCVPGFLFSAHAREPGNEASHKTTDSEVPFVCALFRVPYTNST